MQGDILSPTDELRELFQKIHPHFRDPKYIAFVVITQSCDLARRTGPCAARYINLAVVRELEDVLFSLLDGVCAALKEGVYYQEGKRDAEKLLERLFNQNEHGLGVFYLHPDAEIGIAVPSVALLRVSVAFWRDHYPVFVGARRGRLMEEFRDRLGWLVGNLFSRVATKDWHEADNGKQELNRLIRGHLEPGEGARRPLWVQRSCVEAALRAGERLEDLSSDAIKAAIGRHMPPTPREEIIDRAVQTVKNVLPWLCFEELTKIGNRLANDPALAAALRRARRE
jgi:hypothetical protein